MDNFDIRKWRSQMLIEAAERAEKDYDGDGKIESPEEEYLGSKDKAIKASMKNEAPNEAEYYGVDRDTEMRAAGIGGSTNYMPWKNAKGFTTAVKKYVEPADIQSLSTSIVITKPGSKTFMTFFAKDGFDMDQVVETITPGLKRMSKVKGLHFLIQKIDANSFTLSAKKPYDTFTDDLGKELNIDKSSKYYIEEPVNEDTESTADQLSEGTCSCGCGGCNDVPTLANIIKTI